MSKLTCSTDRGTNIYRDASKPNHSLHMHIRHNITTTQTGHSNYLYNEQKNVIKNSNQLNSTIESVAIWFLNKSTLSHKKLQKLCYYAYCWYIIFFNDIEDASEDANKINVLCADKFQAWIHGPVSPRIYRKYKSYGWRDIPCPDYNPTFDSNLEELLETVWNAYGDFSAEELEILSHSETPWIKARINIDRCEPCSNEISDYEILKYYSNLCR